MYLRFYDNLWINLLLKLISFWFILDLWQKCFSWTKVNEIGKTNNNNLEFYTAVVNLTDLKQRTVQISTVE